jgi:ACS family glucarate transporter-like MFS transporter
MSAAADRPTNVRFLVVAVTAFAALWMYIDRVCFSTLAPGIRTELGIDEEDMSYVLGAFFFTYALFQIPVGSLADRYGPRAVLTCAIVAWSLCTAATSLAGGALTLLTVRLCLGACESGAYPAAAGLVRRWASAAERGVLSSVVGFGGRIGGVAAPVLTAFAALTLFGDPVAKVQNWRPVFLLYGLLGLAAAALFWLFARDAPAKHPRANAAEAARVPPPPPAPAATGTWLERLFALTASPNMWLFGGLQFFVNLSWAFLITSLPAYLHDRYGTELEDVGPMQTTALAIGCLGMALGGLFADQMFRKFGPRWGRSAPLAVVMGFCAATYLSAVVLPNAWLVIVALGLMAFLVDLANPTIWAFAQDVGGRYVGASLGWGNMLGNFGAAVSPVLLQIVRHRFGWDVAFVLCACSFVLAGVCAFNMNALIPVTPREPPEADKYREPA